MLTLHKMEIILIALAVSACLCGIADARPIRVIFGNGHSACDRLAAAELRFYLGKLFTDGVDAREGEADILVGAPEDNPTVRSLVESGRVHLPDGPNSDQGYTLKTVGDTICITGRTSQGVLYGVYELLEQYGCYFQIDGEVLPEKARYRAKRMDITRSPVFKYRGLLPWDNFLCGMSGYDLEDYKELIERGTRMKLNMLQFHFYPGLAFFTEKWDTKPVDPSFIGMPVDVFETEGAVGKRAFEGMARFAPKPYVDNIGNPRAQAEACQEMMRRVISYAQNRGWKTCVGFELMHPVGGDASWTDKQDGLNFLNPLDRHNVDLSVDRYRTLVETYPRSDFYWMWQSEARGWFGRNVGHEPGAAEMRAKYAHWASSPDLAGDIDYAYLFREVANRLTPEERSRLATGGWSVEHLFPRIDLEFPKEMIFASLNAYHPPSAIDNQISSFGVAKSGRRAWMAEWWEFDGNQWFPQFRAGWQERMYERCVEYGVESVTLLGWKLSGVEHNIRYLADFSWRPDLSADEFYADYVTRLYGPAARSLASIYKSYDALEPTTPAANAADYRAMLLGAGWQPLGIPPLPVRESELNDAAWKTNIEASTALAAQHRKLLDMDGRAIAEFEGVLPQLSDQGRAWAGMMVNRLEFRRLYVQSMMALNESYLVFDRTARKHGIEAGRVQTAASTARSVELARRAIEKYAEVVPNRGDQGVVAQLNEQYYKPLRMFHRQLAGERSPYVQVDNTAFRLRPEIVFDFSQPTAWSPRDGLVTMDAVEADGRPALRLSIGGDGKPFHSVFVRQDVIDLDKSPILDFVVRTETAEPLAIMFQAETGDAWYALNLIGMQSLYACCDSLPPGTISDGRWHRITWDLSRLCRETTGIPTRVIRNLILGTWQNPPKPVVVEFRDFRLGQRNTLD